MDANPDSSSQTHQLRLDPAGRVVIPVDVRRRLGIGTGDPLLLIEDAGGLHLKTHGQALREMQGYFRELVAPDTSLADEVIAGRREEAASTS